MKSLLIITLLSVISLSVCSQPVEDCSVYSSQQKTPYVLPYAVGASFKVYAATEHYRSSNGGVGLYAIDFIMPIGTKIFAARDGEVVSVQESFKDWNNVDLEENYVFIKHDDGTVARYFHLTQNGALVKKGAKVKAGDLIGLSGNTGQSGGPHLHFDVQACGPNLPPNYNSMPCGQTLPVTFTNTKPHTCGLKAKEEYKATEF